MATDDFPRPPKGLSARGRRLWRAVVAEYELSSAELEVLGSALALLDRAESAATIVRAEGLITKDRYGSPKPHPAVDVECRCRATASRLIQQLGVKLVEAPVPRRGTKSGPKVATALRRIG